MNWYRLELGTKGYECFERVTKCGEDGCRKVLIAPKGLSPLHLLDAGVSVLRRGWVQLCRGWQSRRALESPSAEFQSVFGVFLQVKMRSRFF